MIGSSNINKDLVTSEAMKKCIKNYEGLRLKAYLCPAGKWTIGYGHTLGVQPGDVWTAEMADKAFENDVRTCEARIKRIVAVKLTQGQFDALVDFVFNFGYGALAESTLLVLLNKSSYEAAGNQLPRWIHAKVKGKMVPLDGLVKRRNNALKFWLGKA